jgi:hypothetical protein
MNDTVWMSKASGWEGDGNFLDTSPPPCLLRFEKGRHSAASIVIAIFFSSSRGKNGGHSRYDLYDVCLCLRLFLSFASAVAILGLSLQQFAFAWS